LGVDVGGTFTDLFYLDEASGEARIAKASTTPKDLASGLFGGLAALGIAAADIDLIIHGTTIATNALIERKGTRCGLLTTTGFRDVLELGRRERPTVYGMAGLQDPLIPRNLRLEVNERLDANGAVVTPLDETTVLAAADRLAAQGIDTVAVCLLHAYANPAHEQASEADRAGAPSGLAGQSLERPAAGALRV
jgi:N-methylhydantoinase A